MPCLTQIPANHRQQIVYLSYHASHRYQQITGNKSHIWPCLTQIPSNHRQQIVHLTMPHTDTSKSQATNRASYHASHRYQQIPGNKSHFLPCFTQVPANHRNQIVHLTMPHTDKSKSQATNRTSYHASHKYQKITGNKSYILPCLTQIPAQQIVHLTMPHTDTSKSQATNRTSYHASHRYQHITGNKSCFLPCFAQVPANHRQQIVHLIMPHTDTSKSQATNRTSYHASHRYQQITGNKSYILPCLTQIPENHRQQIVHLTMPHTDTSKSQATNRTSYNASYRYQKNTGHLANKSYILPCFTLIPANHTQQIVLLTMPHTDTSKSQVTSATSCHASHR